MNISNESYERLKTKKIDAVSLIEWHFANICHSINRNITFRQKFKNPWVVEVSERIQRDIFIEAFKAIRDFKIEYGRTINIQRDKSGVGVRYTITFNHFGSLKFHLSQLSKLDITELFKKQSNKGTAIVIVTEEENAIID